MAFIRASLNSQTSLTTCLEAKLLPIHLVNDGRALNQFLLK